MLKASIRLTYVACAALLLASGCVTTQRRDVHANGGWKPLPPASLHRELSAKQVLRVAYGDQDSTLTCVVSIKPEQMSIVGLTAMGMRAFTVKFDGTQVHAEAQVGVPQALNPERLLNDVQLVYWPLPELERALVGTEWSVTEPAPGTRRLRRGGQLVAEVHHANPADVWRGLAWLVNLEFGYALSIDSQIMEMQ